MRTANPQFYQNDLACFACTRGKWCRTHYTCDSLAGNSFAIFSTDSWIMIKYQGKNSCFLTFGKIGTMIARMYIFRKVFALIQSNLADSWHAWEWRMRIFESIHTSRCSMKTQLSGNWHFFSITHSTLCTRRKLRNVNDGRTKATKSVRSDTRAHFIFLSLSISIII